MAWGSHNFTCHPRVYPRMEWAILHPLRKHSPDGVARARWRTSGSLTTHLSTSKGWKAELAQLADHIADGLHTWVVTHQLQVEGGTGTVRRPPLCKRSQSSSRLSAVQISILSLYFTNCRRILVREPADPQTAPPAWSCYCCWHRCSGGRWRTNDDN